MSFLEILLIAVGLSMDAAAVSLCAGASGYARTARPALRLALHFGVFQAVMPLIGWLAGNTIAPWIAGVDHWIAFGMLAFVAARMIRSGWRAAAPDPACDPPRGSNLVLLSVAPSIDAMAVGFSLALLATPILIPALAIGVVTFALSAAAARLGGRLNLRFGQRMEILGGLVLLAIGLRILLSHLLPV
jgi:manganese efflux pump family protein